MHLNITNISYKIILFSYKMWYNITVSYFSWVGFFKTWDFKFIEGGFLCHYFGGSFGVTPWTVLNWLFFLRRLGSKNFSTLFMKDYYLYPNYLQQSHIICCLNIRDTITGCKYPEYGLVFKSMELEFWLEEVKVLGAPIMSR